MMTKRSNVIQIIQNRNCIIILICLYHLLQRPEIFAINSTPIFHLEFIRILIEKPKMAPHIDAMRNTLADSLGCTIDQISVKATRGEGLGFVGRQEGVVAQAIVLLEKK